MAEQQAAHRRSERALERAERQQKVLELVKRGANYADVADELGCSYATVRRDVKRALERLARETVTATEQWRALQLARLEDLYRGMLMVHPSDLDDGEVHVGERMALGQHDPYRVDRLLKILERQAKLLGLDAPQRIDGLPAQGLGVMVRVDLTTDAELAAYAERPPLQLVPPADDGEELG